MTEKGTPYRKTKERAEFMLEDFADHECRTVLLNLLDSFPGPTIDEITAYWETGIEAAKEVRNAHQRRFSESRGSDNKSP